MLALAPDLGVDGRSRRGDEVVPEERRGPARRWPLRDGEMPGMDGISAQPELRAASHRHGAGGTLSAGTGTAARDGRRRQWLRVTRTPRPGQLPPQSEGFASGLRWSIPAWAARRSPPGQPAHSQGDRRAADRRGRGERVAEHRGGAARPGGRCATPCRGRSHDRRPHPRRAVRLASANGWLIGKLSPPARIRSGAHGSQGPPGPRMVRSSRRRTCPARRCRGAGRARPYLWRSAPVYSRTAGRQGGWA